MSGDLVSMRLLCVTAVPSLLELWRQGAAMASVPVDFSGAAAPAGLAELSRGGVDICLVDSALPERERARVISSACAAEPRPFVAACAPRAAARVDGVDRVLPRPNSAEDARRLIEFCLRVKIPTRVLVVDDSETTRSVVRKILSASRFALEIHETNEGSAALNQVRDGRFGMIFLDHDMPGMSGFETLKEIRRENPSIAVVMMATAPDESMSKRANAAGALAFLKKPFYPADVDALLDRHFGMPEH